MEVREGGWMEVREGGSGWGGVVDRAHGLESAVEMEEAVSELWVAGWQQPHRAVFMGAALYSECPRQRLALGVTAHYSALPWARNLCVITLGTSPAVT